MKKSDSDSKSDCTKQQKSLKNIGNNNGEMPLHIAAKSNRAIDVKTLLDAGVDANALDRNGNTPLHLAVVAKAVEVVKVLMSHSTTDLNAPRKDGETPFILALSFMGQEKQLIVDLINAGANVNAKSVRRGTTALHWATMNNCLDLVDELMEKKANLEARDGYGRTPLHYAKPRIAKILIDAGADTTAQDHAGYTPLHLAVLGRDLITFRALLEHTPNLNTRTRDVMTPLMTAVNVGMEAMTTDLLSAGVDIDATDLKGMTALHLATLNNCVNLVDALLEHQPNVNIRDESGCTPLHYAKAETASKLLDAGADADVLNNGRKTPLHLAVLNRDTAVFQVLLPKTTDLNTQTRDGVTPLMTAVYKGLENMAIDLVGAGADLDAADHNGITALHTTVILNRLNLANVILQDGADLNIQDAKGCTPLHYAKADIARCLIDAGADANVQNNIGLTPLHAAVAKLDLTMFLILLPHATHLNSHCVDDGITPLLAAVKNAMENMVYHLIKAGADVRVSSCEGMTALHWAANFCDLPNCEDAATSRANIARMLLEAGAEANARNMSDDTPLHVALKTKAWPVFKVLLRHKSTDVNVPHVSGKTLLMLMLQSHSEIKDEVTEVLKVFEKLIIKTGASIEARDIEGMSALHYAAKFGKCNELNLLLKHGADIHAVDQNKMTALHWASFFHILVDIPTKYEVNLITWKGSGEMSTHYYDKTDIIKRLVAAGANTIAQDNEGRTPLHSAVIRGDINVFRLLLYNTPILYTSTSNGMTPLMSAVDLGMEEMVFYLIQAGAPVAARDSHGANALHFAANFSKLPENSKDIATRIRKNMAKMLMNANADPNLQNKSGDTPLHVAVKTKAWPVVEVLLRCRRTQVNVKNMQDDGKTPLMMILEGDGNVDVFEDLIKVGACIHETDSRGRTAVHYATQFNKFVELELLLHVYGADINAVDENGNTALLLAAELNLPEIFDMLEYNCHVNKKVQRTSDGKTLLMILIESNMPMRNFDGIAIAVEDVNVKDKKLQTAIHYAAKFNKVAQLITLVDLDADINARDCDGQTPLFVAASEGHYQACYNLLSVYCANADIGDINGKKPIDIAREKNHRHIVEYFNEITPAG